MALAVLQDSNAHIAPRDQGGRDHRRLPFAFQVVLRLGVIAVGYYLTGRLGVSLAIPPGYATAVWPASGIALAGVLLWGYRYWPGIVLGSFAVNISLAGDLNATSAGLALLIATGAALQAVIGAILVRHFLKMPNPLISTRDIVILLLMGGPVACAVNGIIGPSLLIIFGITGPENFFENMATWWVGDVIGVIVFTPVLLMLMGSAGDVSKSRKIVVSAAMISVFMVAVALFTFSKYQQAKLEAGRFGQTASNISRELGKDLEIYLNILIANGQFMKSVSDTGVKGFENFTDRFLVSYPGLFGLSWNRKVLDQDRKTFEQSMVDKGFPDYVIKNRFSAGRLDPAPTNPVYFPVTYTVPFEKNRSAHGFDTYGRDAISGSVRADTLDRARDLGRPMTTGRVNIVQAEGSYGLLIYNPVFRAGADLGSTAESRSKALLGYTAGIFLIPELMAPTMKFAADHGMNTVLYDVTDPAKKVLLYDSRTGDFQEPDQPITPHPEARRWTSQFEMAGSQWELQLIETDQSVLAQRSWVLWAVLIGGLVFTALLGSFLLVLTGRAEEKLALVDSLEQANHDLERFANIAAHDLREPLRRIEVMCGFLRENIEASGQGEDISLVNKMNFAVTEMRLLVDDFHELSRLAALETTMREQISLQRLVETVMEGFEEDLDDKTMRAEIRNLPVRRVNTGLVRQLFTNLISNAIKYADGGDLSLDVSYNNRTGVFSVTNSGSFINDKYLDHIFDPFMRVRKDTPGSGLGLYICRRVVESHGGKIWAESDAGQVSIRFTMKGG